MRILLNLPLLAIVVAYPSDIQDDKMIVDADYYPENLIIYEGEHDIVDIMIPLNRASMQDSFEVSTSTELSYLKQHLMVFFVEADIKNGQREDQGIYMYINGKVTKIMDKGRAVAASADDSGYVFLGAKDGLYVYNPRTMKADKYGKFNDSIKDMAKEQNTDVIYILTDDRQLYKVYDAAAKKVKIDDVEDADQIMMDYSNNLYYYGKDKKLYVRNNEGEINIINGLPDGAEEIRLFRSPMFNNEGVGLLVDNELYTIYADGTLESENLEFLSEAKPTAYSMEAGIYRYFGFNKKIYEYDLMSMTDSAESASDYKPHSKIIILSRLFKLL